MTIMKNSNRYTALAWLTVVAFILLGLAMAIISGCTDTLKGDADPNKAPIVYFVNIPPDDSEFSHNPEIYWFGSDVDGQIVYFRYFVATVAEVGSDDYSAARQWAAGQDDQAWHYVDVDPTLSDPQTTRVIPLSADSVTPITTYVEQFVFLQAFDDDNLGSVIAVKCLNRNDHPPQTEIYNSLKNDSPYVNAATEGGTITGVGLIWYGDDRRDYDEQGLVAPPFEYEWKVYGPFNSTEIEAIRDIDSGGYVQLVWFDDEGEKYLLGDTMIITDSNLVGEGDERHWEPWVDTIVFDPATQSSVELGFQRDTLVDLSAPMISSKLVETSSDGYDSWVSDTTEVIYDLYRNVANSDVTVTQHFLFSVRARDDAFVPDPTPAFCTFPVIEPRNERGVLVIDFTNPGSTDLSFAIHTDSSNHVVRRALFENLIKKWNPVLPFVGSGYDDTGLVADYIHAGKILTDDKIIPLGKILQYKMMIWYSDHNTKSFLEIGDGKRHDNLLKAVDAGVNVWAMGRGLLAGGSNTGFYQVPLNLDSAAATYLGVESMFFSGWLYFHRITTDEPYSLRIEDFVGAYSVDESKWPNLDIDPDLLRDRYYWPEENVSMWLPACPFRDSLAALPEVNWCGRTYGTEVMYLYKSYYGPDHFLGFPFAIEGAPCAHRLETDLYRSVFFMFPPWPLKEDQMQELAGGVLDWLYEPWLDR